MKIALIATPSEIRLYARCLSSLDDVQWIGFGGYPCNRFCRSLLEGNGGLEVEIPYFESAEALIDAADAVLVAGRRKDRFGFISRVLRKGRSVWTLGPVCETWEETAKLASLAQEARVCNQVVHLDRETALMHSSMPYAEGLRLLRFESFCPADSSLNADWENLLLFPAFDMVLALGGDSVRKMKGHAVSCGEYRPASIVVDFEFMSGLEAFLWMDRIAGSRSVRATAVSPTHVLRMDFLRERLEIRQSSSGFYPEISPVRPLADNVKLFVEAVRTGCRSRFGLMQSSAVQERFIQLKKSFYV